LSQRRHVKKISQLSRLCASHTYVCAKRDLDLAVSDGFRLMEEDVVIQLTFDLHILLAIVEWFT
jgi:hypothetical protein